MEWGGHSQGREEVPDSISVSAGTPGLVCAGSRAPNLPRQGQGSIWNSGQHPTHWGPETCQPLASSAWGVIQAGLTSPR